MTQAGFEEREYERPLYAELQVAHNRLWSPGQVLEGRFGFDTTFFSPVSFPYQIYGSVPPPGVILSRYTHFFRHQLHAPPRRKLPVLGAPVNGREQPVDVAHRLAGEACEPRREE
jgi:hypothetical protein